MAFRVQHSPDVAGQLVHVLRQIAELIGTEVVDPVGKIAFADPGGTFANVPNRPEQPAHGQVGNEEPDQADCQDDRQQIRTGSGVGYSRRGDDNVVIALVDFQKAVLPQGSELDIFQLVNPGTRFVAEYVAAAE